MAKLDQLDRQILQLLLKDANSSFVEIAKQVHVSAGTVHVRVKQLRQAGIIQGASLKVDHQQLGLELMAFVGIHLERSSLYMEVLKGVQRIPEVVQVHYVTGPYNMFVQVVAKNSQDLHRILQDEIQEIKGVQQTESFLSLQEHINRPIQVVSEEDDF